MRWIDIAHLPLSSVADFGYLQEGEKHPDVAEAASADLGDNDRARGRAKEREWDWESTSDRFPGRTSSQGGSR